MSDPDIVDLTHLGVPSAEVIGTKGHHLADVRAHGFSTADGFVLTTTLYDRTVHSSRIERQLDEIWDSARNARPERLHVLARKARHLMSELRISPEVAENVIRRAETFGPLHTVAVRSSLPPDAISGPECSGIHASYINVGPDQILARIRSCWASLFGERALMLRSRGLGDARPSMAVIVQPMVDARKSGIAVPLETRSDILIEATFGLGDPIVMGAVEPDSYVFDTHSNAVRSKTIGRKQIVLQADNPLGHSFAPPDQEFLPVLDDAEARSLATLCTDVAREFGRPHEIEWAIGTAGPIVLQIRPVEISMADHTVQVGSGDGVDGLVTGLGVGLGSATGPVRVVLSDDDVAAVKLGDVIVAADTEPRWRPHLLRAAAIVTDGGDEHSHPARIAREYGIPTVVATSTGTTNLIEGDVVTVDAHRGIVHPSTIS